MTTPRRPNHADLSTRGKPGANEARKVPDQPSRGQLTGPEPPGGAAMSGENNAAEPMRRNGAPAPVHGDDTTDPMPGNGIAVPVGGDDTTESMLGQEILASARQDIGRAGPAAAQSRNPGQSGPGDRIGQYELIRLLGRGGMGEVHLARDLRLGRLVAVKRLSAHGTEVTERFLREARTTARCMHENIVVIHEVGEHEGHPYMVLEYLEGETLRQWLREHAAASGEQVPVPPGRAVELMLPVVRALAYAHERGIVHRDLKPENVMLTRSGTIKVLDFGIAKLLSAPRPDEEAKDGVSNSAVDATSGRVSGPVAVHSSALIGTLPYMSPEQMNVGVINHRSDIWTVGIMLFELVTGRHPIPERSVAALMRIADEDEPMPSVCQSMPYIGPLAGIIDRCLLKRPEHRTPSARSLLAELEALAPTRRAVLVGSDVSPFTGLTAFQEPDADRFFGRDHEITSIAGKLRSLPLVTVTGPSGAGKSSLVRAGVIPALKRSGEGWEAIIIRPGRQPLAALAEVLLAPSVRSSEMDTGRSITRGADQVPADRGAVMNRLRIEPGYLGIALRTWARVRLRRLVLFVDQFEELYTLGANNEERACVLACLGAVADDVESPLRVILSVRSDFLDRLVEQRTFLDTVSHGLTFLSPLDRSGLREALTRPMEVRDHRFDSPAMIERILDELETTRSPLPLLQFTADKLWAGRDRQQRMLSESSLRALGGVSGCLASHADSVLASMPTQDARLARAVFLRLVTPEHTRALATMVELRQLGDDVESMSRVLTRLIDARLLAVGGSTGSAADGGESDGMVEIVHESLIDTWPLLGQWLVESEEDAIFLARLRSAARDWERSGHAAGLLWTGEAAGDARAWHRRYQGELAPAEKQYLAAVSAATERQHRLRRQILAGTFAVVTLLATTMAYLAWQESKASRAAKQAAASFEQESVRAEKEAIRARDATRMAVARGLPDDPTTQLALLREIEDTNAPPRGATHELRRLLHADVARMILTSTSTNGQIWSLALSPDGSRIAAGTGANKILVWNADGSGEPVVLHVEIDGRGSSITSLIFSPDSSRIAIGSADGTVSIWSANGSGAPLVFRGNSIIKSLAFCSNGSRIAAASMDSAIHIWNTENLDAPMVLRGHQRVLSSAAFSPDCSRIASFSYDKTVQVWNIDGSGAPIVLRGQDVVSSVVFSPDGSRIAAASPNGEVCIWNADGAGAPVVLSGHESSASAIAFSSDGSRLVSGSFDRTVRIWNTDGSGTPRVLRGHKKEVIAVGFDASGTQVASASHDNTVRVWNANPSYESWALSAPVQGVRSFDLSPDGSRILSAHDDGTVRMWNTDGSGASIILHDQNKTDQSVAFSVNGIRVAATSIDGTVYVWNTEGSRTPILLRGHHDRVASVDFSPDGSRIVTASINNDRTVRIWNADGTGSPIVLRGHNATALSLQPPQLSPSAENSIRAWSSDGPGALIITSRRIFPALIVSSLFVPDYFRVRSNPDRDRVPVWSMSSPDNPFVDYGNEKWMSSAVFSPDGTRIAFASEDAVLVWNADGSGGNEDDGVVEIVHESLIDTWPLLARWLGENEADAVFLARLRSAAADWERSGHATGLLWSGEAARGARSWQQRYQGELAPAERHYLDAILAAAERSRRRLFVGAMAMAMATAVTVVFLAHQQREANNSATQARDEKQRAEQEAKRAEQAANEAEQAAMRARDATRMMAMRALPEDPTTQLALLREIEATSAPPPGAVQEAKRLLHASVASTILTGHSDTVWSASFDRDGARIVTASGDKTVRIWRTDGTGEPVILRGHDDRVHSAAFSPGGDRIVSASKDKTVRIWRTDGTGEPLILRGHSGAVWSAWFSPDGTRVVSASSDKTVRVWNADGRGEPLILGGHAYWVRSAAFSPDGKHIVSASLDKTVRVWRADGTGKPLILRGHDFQALSAAFSPDGQRIVSASLDKTVRVWNADGRGEPLVLRGHDDIVMSAAFSPDGQRIVSASGDKTVLVWNVDGRGEPLALRGHDQGVMSVAFSPDGKRIASASLDAAVRVWEMDGIDEPLVLRGHDDGATSVAFSPDGKHIVSASMDKAVKVWNADGSGEPLVLRGHNDRVVSASFSPDGQRIVSASRDKTVRIWNADGRGKPLVLRGHDHEVEWASFDHNGTRIVSASWDATVRVWNADGRGEPLVLRGHDDAVWSAAFSPNGQRIASASWDETVRVWNADGRGEPLVLRGHDDAVVSVAFSPDGEYIVSASWDKTVRVWDADGRGEPRILDDHDDWVSEAAFSPDGKYIVSASKDKTIRIWRADGTGEPVILAGHGKWVNDARFSPDGRRIVSGSDDRTVRVWHDLARPTLDDPRLWTATTYCMPVERRQELLGVSEEEAQRDRQRCLERVEQARRAETERP
jgi:WD40 repeat protein/serine/threonine protein kinase/cell division protein FtsL